MASFTVTQWAIMALVFVAGWLLGLASHSGGRKWRERYAAEREAHAASRRDVDARVAAAETRRAELERENAGLRSAAPVTAAPVAAPNVVPRPVVTRTAAARPAYPAGERRGWFDWGPRTA